MLFLLLGPTLLFPRAPLVLVLAFIQSALLFSPPLLLFEIALLLLIAALLLISSPLPLSLLLLIDCSLLFSIPSLLFLDLALLILGLPPLILFSTAPAVVLSLLRLLRLLRLRLILIITLPVATALCARQVTAHEHHDCAERETHREAFEVFRFHNLSSILFGAEGKVISLPCLQSLFRSNDPLPVSEANSEDGYDMVI